MMLNQQIVIELKKALSYNRLLIRLFIIGLPILIQFFIIKNGYTFSSSIEVFQRLLSGFLPMIFPLLMILIYADSLVIERKENYLLYTRTRIWLPTYLLSKGIVNALLAFVISFILIFSTFLFAVYIEPGFSFIQYGGVANPATDTTFNQFLVLGTFTYGILYSSWVAINGMVYATLTYLLTLCIDNPFIALSIPFVWYQIMNFITAILSVPQFSPLSTIFPYNLTQQELWTVLLPFSILLLATVGLIILLMKRKRNEWLI
ncbi:ABC transporter permease [Sporosarcina trichiuri]|uniref:ABC transporter permease n=1 Tax=Sporosarcina trichiuri TaxID=3056445 RepID=UPI0025B28ABF|nr:ABC transporter permease [Sporosarcina sp. 0.2-SM1T-5]WJY26567.1 ABC transporter permease [Sporosarcina sp. 0.2-SM1T-5]